MPVNVMRHEEFFAEVKYDPSADSFHGRVLGIADTIDFYGRSTDELRREFKKSIKEYLAWCVAEGEEPRKTWQGKLTIRPNEELRRRLVVAATASGESVNSWVLNVLDRESRKILEDV
jgi:predicted HicB family RNase H-like nuclease